MDDFRVHFKNYRVTFKALVKWLVISVLIGSCTGLIAVLFYYGMDLVTSLRLGHPWLIFFLPVGGLAIVCLYRFLDDRYKIGTTLVLSAIHDEDEVPLRITPLIILSTWITHLFGGSAGREGAALQIGGSLGDTLAHWLHMRDADRRIFIMCGMAAAFSALFGTPMAAAVFAIEVVSVGMMHYYALFPCVIASVTAREIAILFGAFAEQFTVTLIPEFNLYHGLRIIILAVLCTEVGVLFCIILHKSEKAFKTYFKNDFVRIVSGALMILLLSLIFRSGDYNGTGMNVIERCFSDGDVASFAFVLKILFTAITLGCGFKGGEIVPSLFIGATSGYLFAHILGFSSNISVACGMIAVFCGVTNCPLASLLMAFEMFDIHGMNYYMITVAVSFIMSGYHTLYRSQLFAFSKTKENPYDPEKQR